MRRSIEPIAPLPVTTPPATGVAPLLAKLIDQRTATGLPPACKDKHEGDDG
jgi:putative transposase